MKTSFWDILTIFAVIGIILIGVVVLVLFQNPTLPMNPFPPNKPLPTVFLPSPTNTPQKLPTLITPTLQGTPENLATLRASSTPLPSFTPFVLPSSTLSPITYVATLTRMPFSGKCKVVSQEPKDDTIIKAGEEFQTIWVVENTADTDWTSDSVDIKFLDGDRMQVTDQNVIDLGTNVLSNRTFSLKITMKAPSDPGYHITYWGFVSGSTNRCVVYVEIFVEK